MANNLLARAITTGTPLTDGDEAIFVWNGDKPPTLIGDFTDWENGESGELSQVQTEIWTYRLRLPPDAYIEYIYLDGDNRMVDVHNRRSVSNGVGERNHYFTCLGEDRRRWCGAREDSLAG